MTQTDAEFIAEIAALAEKAKRGPWWKNCIGEVFSGTPSLFVVASSLSRDDAAFIVASRTAVPRLIEMVEGLTQERNDARAGRRLVSKGAMDLGAEHCFVVAERDAALSRAEKAKRERDEWHDRAGEAQVERDASRDERDTALAEVARLREALIDIGFRQNLSRDQIVMFARAALAPKE